MYYLLIITGVWNIQWSTKRLVFILILCITFHKNKIIFTQIDAFNIIQLLITTQNIIIKEKTTIDFL